MKRASAVKTSRVASSNLIIFQTGLTIVELMISLMLGLFVLMAASALLLSSKSGYTTLDDATRLQDTGRYAIEVIARSVRQTSYANWDKEDSPTLTSAMKSADVRGMDAHSLSSATPDIQSPISSSINGSDVLAVRYFGSGSGTNGDGTILNCAGFGVPGIASSDSVEEGRGWSIFYVETDQSGEPELRCKYQGKNSWTSAAIARGVESFQVLYGVDTDSDGLPNQFVSATALDQMDQGISPAGQAAQPRQQDRNKKTYWKKVVAIKVALLVRGSEKSRSDSLSKQYKLFGSEYGAANAADAGTLINEENIPATKRNRLRKLFQQTIMLRNRSAGFNA